MKNSGSSTIAPLPLADWHFRWLHSPTGERLHRVAELDDLAEVDDGRTSLGRTLCDRRTRLHMPGVISRMMGERCARCCVLVGIPPGEGVPFNVLTGADRDK